MTDVPSAPPTFDAAAAAWRTLFGAELPDVCRAGVAQALALLAEHRRIVAAALSDA